MFSSAGGFGSADVVAFPGEEGSLSHGAAARFCRDARHVKLLGVSGFAAAFGAVARGEAGYAVIPIENSASGSLHSNYDLLVKHDVVICAELGVRETYCLCVVPGVELSSIRRVMSHPRILEACSGYLETKLGKMQQEDVSLVPTTSTTCAARAVAGAASEAAQATVALSEVGGVGATAAVATREAARLFGLEVVADDIGNDTTLQTRYILIRKRDGAVAGKPPPFPHDLTLQIPLQKRSAAFLLRNEPGALFKLLSCWALRGIDVIKIESRPMHAGVPGLCGNAYLWDFYLYVDYPAPPWQTEAEAAKLWEALQEFSLWQRDFGCYPSHVPRELKQEQTWDERVDMMTK